MILADTSVWIDFFRGEDSLERHKLHRLLEDYEDVAVTGIILTEILQGIRNERDFLETRAYLSEFPVLEPNGVTTYVSAARIFRECRKKGKTVRSTVDCIIAAVCLENNIPILHKDSDYDIIKECAGLRTVPA